MLTVVQLDNARLSAQYVLSEPSITATVDLSAIARIGDMEAELHDKRNGAEIPIFHVKREVPTCGYLLLSILSPMKRDIERILAIF
jgi:hypothetical protein